MNAGQGYVLGVLGLALVLFAWGRWRFDIVALLAALAVVIPGLVPADEAFSGFGHPAVITVAAILVITRALRNSGLVDAIADRLAGLAHSPTLQTLGLCATVAVASAFMNNVGALALMMPVALHNAHRIDRPASELLMPISFASLLGGLITLMGTPPNVIISAFRQDAVGEPFSIFDFAPVGATVALVGVLFMGLVGWRLVPRRATAAASGEHVFEVHDYLTEIRVPESSDLQDTRFDEFLTEVDCNVRVVGVARQGRLVKDPGHNRKLKGGDVLVLEGQAEDLDALVRHLNVQPFAMHAKRRALLEDSGVHTVEAIVSTGSVLLGRTAQRTLVGQHMIGGALFAIARKQRRVRGLVSRLRLQVGDVLLFKGDPDTIEEQLTEIGCLPLAKRALAVGRQRQKLVPVVLLGAAIVAASLDAIAIHVAFVGVAAALLLLNFLTPREVYDSIDWPVIVLLGAFFPVGQALESTGATDLIAAQLVAVTATLPPYAIVALLLASSMWLSDIINNAAAALVMGPIAAAVAHNLGLNVDALLMAVAVGCSCTFLTPIGHQSNALVFGPGGYRFGDYWRLGLPLQALVLLSATALIPLVWTL